MRQNQELARSQLLLDITVVFKSAIESSPVGREILSVTSFIELLYGQTPEAVPNTYP